MTTTLWKRTGALGACVAAIALLAGCGGGNPAPVAAGPAAGKAPADVAREAPEITRVGGTSRYALEMTYSSSGGQLDDLTIVMNGTGTYDYAGRIGDGTLTRSGNGRDFPPQDVVFRENGLYQRDAGTARWKEYDSSALVNTPFGQLDPGRQLDLLRGVSDEVRDLGTTQVRGADVRQYAITIDPQRLAAASGAGNEGWLTETAMRSVGPMPGAVFVDADGRVRRFEVLIEDSWAEFAASPELAEAAPEVFGDPALRETLGGIRTAYEVSIEYFDFGVPVTARVPDPTTVDPGPVIFPTGPR